MGRRHAEYFARAGAGGGAALAAGQPGEWLDRLEAEQANLRAALTWLRDHEESGPGLRLAAALGAVLARAQCQRRGPSVAGDVPGAVRGRGAGRGPRSSRCGGRGSWLGWRGTCRRQRRTCRRAWPWRVRRATRRHRGRSARVGSAVLQNGDVAGSIAPLAEAARSRGSWAICGRRRSCWPTLLSRSLTKATWTGPRP